MVDEGTAVIEVIKIGGPVLATVLVEEFFRWKERVSHRETVSELNKQIMQMSTQLADLHTQALDTIRSNSEVLAEFLTVIKERLPRG